MVATVAGLIAYSAERGTVIADNPATAQALMRATDYIQFNYLEFGNCTVDSPNVEAATYEAAIIEVSTPFFWSKTFTPADQKVLTGVKGITWTVTGDASRAGSSTPRSTKIDAMLRACGGGVGWQSGAFTV